MKKIKSIEEVRLQQQLRLYEKQLAELKMKKKFYDLQNEFGISNDNHFSFIRLMKTGVRSRVGKQLILTAAWKLARKFFKKRAKA
jgi:hypothetical protein